MTNLEYIRSLHDKLFTMSYEDICRIVYSIGYFCPATKPDKCNDCGPCINSFLKEEYYINSINSRYCRFYNDLNDFIKEKFCREPVKNNFTWNDMFDKNVINPCDYCSAINEFPLCDDGATSSACNHCMYNIYLHMNFEVKED